MKLVYVASSIVPSRTANSIHVVKMCAAFARNGHDVSLIVPRRPERIQGVPDIFEYYGADPMFEICTLPWIELKGRAYLFAGLAAQRARKIRADFVYGRVVHACYLAVLAGVPSMFESHAPVTEFDGLGIWMFKRLIRHPRFRGLVVISDALRRHYEVHYPELAGRITTAPDAADEIPGVDRQERMYDEPGRGLKVGYVGHLYPGRGMDLIAKLAERCSWAEFHIIGGMQKDIDEWRGRCGGVPNIVFHGFCPPAQVQEYMARLDVLLAPYQRIVAPFGGKRDTAQWMSPLKIFEYMAARKAMIVSDLPVLREVLDETNAMLVDPEDVDGWMRALSVLQDPKRREQLSQKAHRDFLASYTWRVRAKRVLA